MSECENSRRLALISVTNKANLIPFVRGLNELGYTLLSTGGTAQEIARNGLPVIQLSEFTGSPEAFDGRLKTLHPKIFGGILHRDTPADRATCKELQIESIDIVAVNLYAFEEAIEKDPTDLNTAIEKIDIGGPSLIRAAAKNNTRTLVVVDPSDYPAVLERLESKTVTESFRFEMAVKAFQLTSRYDSAISNYLTGNVHQFKISPEFRIALSRTASLRYGENPHQEAAFFHLSVPNGKAPMLTQLQGKELSFNNYIDMQGAVALLDDLSRLGRPAAAIVKHTNPCGAALGNTLDDAYTKALSCDPLSAFGGIVALNETLDFTLAAKIAETFYEIIIAPDISPEARNVFERKKNLRLCLVDPTPRRLDWDIKRTFWGCLIQTADETTESRAEWKVVTDRQPTPEEESELAFAWKVVKHVKSNAIVFSKDYQTLGIGAGQMSRIDSCKLAHQKCLHPDQISGAVMASDAFFPFKDCVEEAARVGIRAIIQPGGSLRDSESIEAANQHNMAMIVTGRRHFKH